MRSAVASKSRVGEWFWLSLGVAAVSLGACSNRSFDDGGPSDGNAGEANDGSGGAGDDDGSGGRVGSGGADDDGTAGGENTAGADGSGGTGGVCIEAIVLQDNLDTPDGEPEIGTSWYAMGTACSWQATGIASQGAGTCKLTNVLEVPLDYANMEVRVAAVSSDFAGMSLRFLNDADEAGFSFYLADEWAFGIQEKSTDLGSGSLPYEQTHFYVIRIEDGEITLSAATGNYSDTGGSVVATLEKTLTTSGTVKKIVLGVSGDSTKSAGASDLQVTRLCP